MFSFNARQSCKKGRSGTIYNFKSFFLITVFFSKNVLALMTGCWRYQGDQLKEEHGHHGQNEKLAPVICSRFFMFCVDVP